MGLINMKKILIILCAVLLVACTDENDYNRIVGENNMLRACIENTQEIESRVVINDNKVNWEENDCIGVYGTTTPNIPFKYTNEQGNVAYFKGNLNLKEENVKVTYYPYQEGTELNDNKLTIQLPNEYIYKGNSNAPMLGYKQENGSFLFKHLSGLMQITLGDLPEDAERFVISSIGENAPAITGKAFVNDPTVDNAILVMDKEQTGKVITYHLNKLVGNDGLRHFFVPLPVGNYPKIEVSLYGKDKEEPYFTRTVSKIRVERADMIEMPVINGTTGDNYVLNESVVEMASDLSEVVTLSGTNKDVLIYDKNAPKESIPTVGQIIVSKPQTNLPNGFLGRVTKVEVDNEGNYTVQTEMPALTEVFDKLYVDETVPVTFQEEENKVKSRGILQEGIFNDTKFENEFEIKLQNDFFAYVGTFQHSGNLILNLQLDKENKMEYCAFTWKSDASLSGKLEAFLKSEAKIEGLEKVLAELRAVPIPVAGGLVQLFPVYAPYFVLEGKGTIKTSMEIEGEFQPMAVAFYNNGTWEQRKNASKPKANHESPLNFKQQTEFNGEIFAGISNDFSLRLYNREDLRIYLNPKIGLEVKGEIGLGYNMDEELNIEAIGKAKLTTGLYLTGVVGADASLFSQEDLAAEMELFKFKFWEKELNLIPDIEDLSSDVQQANNGSYTSDVKTEMKGEVLSKDMKVELVVVDKEGNEVATSEPINYNGGKTHEEDPDVVVPLENNFTDLDAGNEYIAYPRITSPLFRGITGNEVIDLKNESTSFCTYNSIRDVLVKIYNDCGGKDWEHQKNWCTDAPVSEWEGVLYDSESNSYYWAFLQNNKLTGTFSIEGCSENIEGYLSEKDLEHIYIKNCPNLRIFCGLNESKLRSVYLENTDYAQKFIGITDNPLLKKIEIYNCDYMEGEGPSIYIDENPSLNTLLFNGSTPVSCDIMDSSIENVSFDFKGKSIFENIDKYITFYGDYSYISNLSVNGRCHLGICSNLNIDKLILKGVTVTCYGFEEDVVPSIKIPYFFAESCEFEYSFVNTINTYGIDVVELSLPSCYIRNDKLIFSKCNNLKKLNLNNINWVNTVDIQNTPNLQYFSCDNSDIKGILFDEHFNNVNFYATQCYTLKQEFPNFYAPKADHRHDWRYSYSGEGKYDSSIDDYRHSEYRDNGYGWWYSGEPASGYHGR